MSADENLRIAIVSEDKCKPKKCRQECKAVCPVVKMGKLCIEAELTSKIAFISEQLCNGCGLCVKRCPFKAITIINLPRSLANETTHRYSANSFKLHRLPTPRPGEVLGLVGTNGIGKSTALKILAGKMKPNFGNFDKAPSWEEVVRYYRGSELQNFFLRILEEKMRSVLKPQYVDNLPKLLKGTVGALISAKDHRGVADQLMIELQLDHVVEREVEVLSGGELQRFAIAMVAVQNADMYMFDEPSSYLDIRQRLKAAHCIRGLVQKEEEAAAIVAASTGGSEATGSVAEAAAALREAAKAEESLEKAAVLLATAKAEALEIAASASKGKGGASSSSSSSSSSSNSSSNTSSSSSSSSSKTEAGGAGKEPVGSLKASARLAVANAGTIAAHAAGAGSVAAARMAGGANKYVIAVEHDLAVLDYLSDYICVLYGEPGVYGVVTMPFSVREGINIFLAGFVPTENLRFRDEALNFKVAMAVEEVHVKSTTSYKYPAMTKVLTTKPGAPAFKLNIEPGEFSDSQIVVLLGENGTGKTTFVRMLAGLLKPDPVGTGEDAKIPEVGGFSISYKPQKISPSFEGTVRSLLYTKIKEAYAHAQFNSDVLKPLHMDAFIDQEVKSISGGELQRVALALCLGKPADVYLIDEPSAYLDSEQRIVASKIIKRFILHAKKTAFIVEHDFIMSSYLADRVVVYDGVPGVEATAHTPVSLLVGMNRFLRQLDISFRRDPTNFRPRINKRDSVKDSEQKKAGTYFYMED